MQKSANISYVRGMKGVKTGLDGKLLESYYGSTLGENRKTRRAYKQKVRFIGNGKNTHISVIGRNAYFRRVQYIPAVSFRTRLGILVEHEARDIHHLILKE